MNLDLYLDHMIEIRSGSRPKFRSIDDPNLDIGLELAYDLS